MSVTEQLSADNRAARDLVRRHRLRTRGLLLGVWLLALLGLCSCNFPFALIFVDLELSKAWFPSGGRTTGAAIGFGLPAMLVGTAVGLTLLLRLPSYGRTERLIAAAQRLGLRFAFAPREAEWEAAAQAAPPWPLARGTPVSAAGLFVGERAGVRLALAEPGAIADLALLPFLQPTYSPLRYATAGRLIVAVLPDVLPRGAAAVDVPEALAADARGPGIEVSVEEGALLVAMPGDLCDSAAVERLLDWCLRLRRSLRQEDR